MTKVWPLGLIGLTALAALVAAGPASPAGTLALTVFVAAGPGMALVRAARLADGWAAIALGTGLSLALGLITSGILLYAGALSGPALLAVLGAVTIAGAVTDLVRAP